MPDLFNIQKKTAVAKSKFECLACAASFEDAAGLDAHQAKTGHDKNPGTTQKADAMIAPDASALESELQGLVDTVNAVLGDVVDASGEPLPPKIKGWAQGVIDWAHSVTDRLDEAAAAARIVKTADADEEMPLAEALEILTDELGEEGRALLVRGLAGVMRTDLGGQSSLGYRVQREMQGRN